MRASDQTYEFNKMRMDEARREIGDAEEYRGLESELSSGRTATAPNPAREVFKYPLGQGPLAPPPDSIETTTPYSPLEKQQKRFDLKMKQGDVAGAGQIVDVTKKFDDAKMAEFSSLKQMLQMFGPEATKEWATKNGKNPDMVDKMKVFPDGKVIMDLPNGGQLIAVEKGDGTHQILHAAAPKVAVDPSAGSLNGDGSLDLDNGMHFTKEQLVNMAESYNKTGKMPSLGMKAGPIRQAIMYYHTLNATEAGRSGAEVAGGWAETKAQTTSLNKLKPNIDFAASFIKNIDKQIDRVDGIFNEIKQENPRLLNIPIRMWEEKVTGSAARAKIKMYITEIANETARLSAGNPQSIAEISGAAAEKWDSIHDLNLSITDMRSLLKETKHAGQLRYDSMQERYDSVVQESQQHPTPKKNSGPAVGSIEDGYRFKGGNPSDPNSWEKVK
jgi:hypothetical protein